MNQSDKLFQTYTIFVLDDDISKLFVTNNKKVCGLIKTNKYNCKIVVLIDIANKYSICYIEDIMVYDIVNDEFIC